jgi:hypothetical protein
MSEWTPILVACLASLPGLLALVANARKQSSDAYASLTTALQTSGHTIDDLLRMLSEVPQLKREIETLKAERADWEFGIALLIAQLVEARMTPRWMPKNVKTLGGKPQNPRGQR